MLRTFPSAVRTAPLAAALLLLLAGADAHCAPSTAGRLASVAPDGVLRWQDDGCEVALFGVNYCVPFVLEYAALGHLQLDRRRVDAQRRRKHVLFTGKVPANPNASIGND